MPAQREIDSYHMIGCMSGTSLDGIDLVYVKFSKISKWSFEILASKTVDYENEWKNKLRKSIYLYSAELEKLNFEFTNFLGDIIRDFTAISFLIPCSFNEIPKFCQKTLCQVLNLLDVTPTADPAIENKLYFPYSFFFFRILLIFG